MENKLKKLGFEYSEEPDSWFNNTIKSIFGWENLYNRELRTYYGPYRVYINMRDLKMIIRTPLSDGIVIYCGPLNRGWLELEKKIN